jgi:hypothetical protein
MSKQIAIFLVGFVVCFADPLSPQNFKPLTDTEVAQQQQQGNTNNDLKIKKFYLDIDPNEIKNVQQKDKEIRETFDRFDDKLVNYKPVIRPIMSMDTIYVHPYVATTLLLPAGSEISHVDTSIALATLKWQQNTIIFRPNSNFETSTLTIIYSLDNKNYVLSVVAKRYEKGEDEKLNIIYSYRDVKTLDALEVVDIFAKVYGYLPNDDYNYIYVDDILYRIIKDEKFGTVMIDKNKYRVETGTIYN